MGYIDDVSLLAIGSTPQHNTQALKVAHREAQKWAKKHGSVFATSKYTLVHFPRNSRVDTTHPLRLPGITIKPALSCKYLGLEIDNTLVWKEHIQRIQQKALQRLTALSSLASSTWGANLATLRQVYQAMILPQLLYGCSTWYQTRENRRQGQPYRSRSVIGRLLAPIQKRAAQIITGAFRTTATNAVEVEAHLLPLDQQMEKLSLQTSLRIISGSTYNTIGLGQKGSEKAPLSHHIRILRKHHKLNSTNLELRHPYIVPPW